MLPSILVGAMLVVGQTGPNRIGTLQPPVASFGAPTAQEAVPTRVQDEKRLPVVKSLPSSEPDPKTPALAPVTNGSYCSYDAGRPGFLSRFVGFYVDEWRNRHHDNNGNGRDHSGADDSNGNSDPPRRALPSPFNTPPFPTAEYQGFPVLGLPVDTTKWAFQKALDGTRAGQWLDDNRIRIYGWVNASVNFSTNHDSNTITSYWVVPNHIELDQFVLRFERQVDTVQQDRMDWGFRVTGDYGIDYRYFTAGGWGDRQLLVHNLLNGWDPTEVWGVLYIPGVAQGMTIHIGRWIACPDIETQFAPDNLMGTHSIQFTVDVYTQTGIMGTIMLNPQWTIQAAIHAGADMAPWYPGATPTGMFGVRWVSKDNNDSFYTVLNAVNNAEYRYFTVDGQPAGHHNYNIIQTTWQHRFNKEFFTKTEGYILWERDAAVGGTPSLGPIQFNSGGGIGPTVPGLSLTYGILNYTAHQLSKKSYVVVRNEWMMDEHGTRYGFAGNYSSHSIGFTYFITPSLMFRPEYGYYRSYDNPAFDNGQKSYMHMVGCDVTWRF